MKKSSNVRYAEVAVAQTNYAVIDVTDPVKIVCIFTRRASGSAVETVTLKRGDSTTIIDFKVNTDYDLLYVFPQLIDSQGLLVTTSAQAHVWIGVSGEANKGVHAEHGSISPV